MACKGCQQRREEIARIAAKVGTIVFGGKKRVLRADQLIQAGSAEVVRAAVEEGKRGKPGT